MANERAYESVPRVEAMERDTAEPLEISVFPFTDDDVALGEAPLCCAIAFYIY